MQSLFATESLGLSYMEIHLGANGIGDHEHLDLLFSDASKIQFCIRKKNFITTNI